MAVTAAMGATLEVWTVSSRKRASLSTRRCLAVARRVSLLIRTGSCTTVFFVGAVDAVGGCVLPCLVRGMGVAGGDTAPYHVWKVMYGIGGGKVGTSGRGPQQTWRLVARMLRMLRIPIVWYAQITRYWRDHPNAWALSSSYLRGVKRVPYGIHQCHSRTYRFLCGACACNTRATDGYSSAAGGGIQSLLAHARQSASVYGRLAGEMLDDT